MISEITPSVLHLFTVNGEQIGRGNDTIQISEKGKIQGENNFTLGSKDKTHKNDCDIPFSGLGWQPAGFTHSWPLMHVSACSAASCFGTPIRAFSSPGTSS